MAFSLPRLPPGQIDPAAFQIWWQQVVEAIEGEVGALEAADAANAAATAALAAAATATAAAATAQTTANDITDANALANSYVSGTNIITATDAGSDVTITIAAHTRHYPQADGSTVDVAVSGGTLTGRAYDTRYFVTYLDALKAGGAVSYSTTTAEPAQIGDLHVVGEAPPISSGASPTTGGTVRPPGSGSISYSS